MSRLIDADKLHYKSVYIADGYDAKRAVVVLAKEIDKAKTVNPWIPVTKRLPDSKQHILFCDVDGDEYIGKFYEDRWYADFEDRIKSVTAWMPLPDPYTESVES